MMKIEKDDIDDDSKIDSDDNEAFSDQKQALNTQNNFIKDTHSKKYKAEIDISNISEDENKDQEEMEKKIVEKSPKGRFVRYDEALGNGSFKRVYKGYDLDQGKEVAWNVISLGGMSEENTKKIIEEINLIKKLHHPAIINYISGWVNESKREVIFTTDLYSGSLKQYLSRIKYPRLRVIKMWCREILKGLKYLHDQEEPIIHRDIKCDNIFIDQNDGKITIGDLGYSCVLKNDFANSFSGTPEFMSPEVFEMKYGTGADIYSFGMCLLEMVTLEKPYQECNNILSIYTNSKNGILPNSINRIKLDSVKNFILDCLKNESLRPTADKLLESEFLNDLDSEVNNDPVPILDSNCQYIINLPNKDPPEGNIKDNTKMKNNEDKKVDFDIDKDPKARARFSMKNRTTIAEFNEKERSNPFKVNKKKHTVQFGVKEKIKIGKKSEELNESQNSSDDDILNAKVTKNKMKNTSTNIKNFATLNSKTMPFFKKNEANRKLEILIKDEVIENDKITLILNLKKTMWKNKKRFKFFYNLKNDTYDKVAKELETQLQLDSEETKEFELKLRTSIEEFLRKKNENNQKLNENIQKQIVSEEALQKDIEIFENEYKKIIEKAKFLKSVTLKQNNFPQAQYKHMMSVVSMILTLEETNQKNS